MADNINSFNNDDEKRVPLPIDEARLKEIKAMEAAEQSLIEDLFSTPTKVIPVSNQQKPTVPNQKKPKKKPK